MKPGHMGHLNIRNTFQKEGFPKSKGFAFDFGINSRNLGFGDELMKSSNRRGKSH
jgi:hypothetical protein